MSSLDKAEVRSRLKSLGFTRQGDIEGGTHEAAEIWVRRTRGTEAVHILKRMVGYDLYWVAESPEVLLSVLETATPPPSATAPPEAR